MTATASPTTPAPVLPAITGRTDLLAPWRSGVRIAPVSPVETRHAIHAYYTATVESPDGRHVLYYTSTTANAHAGQLRVLDRSNGAERLLVDGLSTEDSHRAACQQWVAGGRLVVFHDVRPTASGEEQWVVATVDVETGEQRVLVRDRQLAWGQPHGTLVPVYGPHWDPAAHRDLDLLDVTTGELRTVLTADAVRREYPDLIAEEFGDRPISIFFPALSPDLSRVFFKIASPLGGHFRSTQASHRALLVCYDLAAGRLLFADKKWGHPAWHPDSRTILDVPHVVINSDTGARRTIPTLPRLPGSHPSWSPDGSLYVSDVALDRLESFDGIDTRDGLPSLAAQPPHKGEWGIAVVDVAAERLVLIDRFDESHGATSWRRCHPHPIFSDDGRRIYYTTSSTPWSRLHVAETGLS